MRHRLLTTYGLSLAAMLYGMAMINAFGWHTCWQQACQTGYATRAWVSTYVGNYNGKPDLKTTSVFRTTNNDPSLPHESSTCPLCLLSKQTQQVLSQESVDLSGCLKQTLNLFLAPTIPISSIPRPISARGPPPNYS